MVPFKIYKQKSSIKTKDFKGAYIHSYFILVLSVNFLCVVMIHLILKIQTPENGIQSALFFFFFLSSV